MQDESDYWIATAPQHHEHWSAINLAFVADEHRADLLLGWANRHMRARCLCRAASSIPRGASELPHVEAPDEALGLSVVVRQNTAPHLRRTRDGGPLHHIACRHHSDSDSQSANRGWDREVVQHDEEGRMQIRLQFAIQAGDEPASQKAFDLSQRIEAGRTRASRATLMGLLHLIWECAELSEFDQRSPSLPAHVWPRVWRAANRMVARSSGSKPKPTMGELLATPCPAGEFHDAQARRNFAKLSAAIDNSTRMLLVACLDTRLVNEDLRDADAASLSQIFVQQLRDQLQIKVNLWPEVLDRALIQWPSAASALVTEREPVVIMAVAKTHMHERWRLATIEQMVLMRVTDRWIPTDSSYEHRFAVELQRRGRHFVKPLRYDKLEPVHPDFVVLDVEPNIAVEVYGMNTPEYVQRKQEKIAHYKRAAAAGMPSLAWDVYAESLDSALARLGLPSAPAGPMRFQRQ